MKRIPVIHLARVLRVLILAVLLSGRKWLDHPERGEELG